MTYGIYYLNLGCSAARPRIVTISAVYRRSFAPRRRPGESSRHGLHSIYINIASPPGHCAFISGRDTQRLVPC